MSCAKASKKFARFLQDFDGVLPGTWVVDRQTATFSRAGTNIGFRVEPAVSPAPPTPGGGGTVYPNGRRCAGTFRVLHNDRIGALSLPKGRYVITIGKGGKPSCSSASRLLAKFLDDPSGKLPSPWKLTAGTGTFSAPGQSFRVKPGLRQTPVGLRILYGVNGEGLGHATRSQVVAEALLARHDVRVGDLRRRARVPARAAAAGRAGLRPVVRDGPRRDPPLGDRPPQPRAAAATRASSATSTPTSRSPAPSPARWCRRRATTSSPPSSGRRCCAGARGSSTRCCGPRCSPPSPSAASGLLDRCDPGRRSSGHDADRDRSAVRRDHQRRPVRQAPRARLGRGFIVLVAFLVSYLAIRPARG